jgi:hypothetical protein
VARHRTRDQKVVGLKPSDLRRPFLFKDRKGITKTEMNNTFYTHIIIKRILLCYWSNVHEIYKTRNITLLSQASGCMKSHALWSPHRATIGIGLLDINRTELTAIVVLRSR